MILTSYFDESGTHGDSPITVMAGVMANAKQWARFETGFEALKKRHQFQIFHTKKFKKRAGDFRGWAIPQSLALINDMGELTEGAFTDAVSFRLDNADYETDFKKTETPRKFRIDSEYGFCFRNCLLYFLIEAEKRKPRNPNNPHRLNIVLESGHKNAGDAIRIFNEIKSELKSAGNTMLGEITLADKEDCNPLMIADFLAHTSYIFGQQIRARRAVAAKAPEKHESGVTHLSYVPGGLPKLKAALIAQKSKRTSHASR